MEPSPGKREEESTARAAERVDVLLALAIDEPGPAGDCPPLEDIAGWYDGTLPRARVPAVRAHVARCRPCYAAWLALVDAGLGSPARGTIRDAIRRLRAAWIRCLGQPRSWGLTAAAAAAAAAAGMAAIWIAVPFGPGWVRTIDGGYEGLAAAIAQASPDAGRWTWGTGLAARGFGAEPDPIARAAFGAGVRTGLRETVGATSGWMPVLAGLPAEPPPCAGASEPAACEERAAVFHDVGRWATLLHFACALGEQSAPGIEPPDASFWHGQSRVIGEAGRAIDDALPSDDPFARFFADWRAEARAGDDPQQVLCAREASLLSLGLD